MRGISEDDLWKIVNHPYAKDGFVSTSFLINRIKDLNDWKPIDENMPKNRYVLLLTDDNIVVEGYFVNLDGGGYWVDGLNHDKIKPNGWQELPPPKEQP